MPNFEIFSDKILYVKNILPNSLELIDLIEKTDEKFTESDAIPQWRDWNPSSDKNFIYGKLKTSKIFQLDQSCTEAKYIFEEIQNAIKNAFDIYKSNIDKNIGNFGHFSICKYFPGKAMGTHVDVDPTRENFNETVSGVLYMNDEYLGGELYFKNQDICIKPEAGSMVIFPSIPPFFHESKTLINNNKYLCTVFCSNY
jgi:hypothetical protein